jgi:hypothetical protein|nr:MAG: hypothetical protein [Bacteriophage sp.]
MIFIIRPTDTTSQKWQVVFLYTFLRKRGQEMKKLFISQPMNGKADEEILAE